MGELIDPNSDVVIHAVKKKHTITRGDRFLLESYNIPFIRETMDMNCYHFSLTGGMILGSLMVESSLLASCCSIDERMGSHITCRPQIFYCLNQSADSEKLQGLDGIPGALARFMVVWPNEYTWQGDIRVQMTTLCSDADVTDLPEGLIAKYEGTIRDQGGLSAFCHAHGGCVWTGVTPTVDYLVAGMTSVQVFDTYHTDPTCAPVWECNDQCTTATTIPFSSIADSFFATDQSPTMMDFFYASDLIHHLYNPIDIHPARPCDIRYECPQLLSPDRGVEKK